MSGHVDPVSWIFAKEALEMLNALDKLKTTCVKRKSEAKISSKNQLTCRGIDTNDPLSSEASNPQALIAINTTAVSNARAKLRMSLDVKQNSSIG